MSRTPSKKPAEPLVVFTRSEAVTRLLAGLPICEQDVRWGVAKNVNTPVEVLTVLAKDQHKDVRESVAKNVNTPVEVLKVLVKDQEKDVRESVARNVNTSGESLMVLAKDKDRSVR